MSELNELASALAEAQGEIEPAPKDAANPFYRSRYASLPAVRAAMQGAFAKHGLSVVQMPEVADGQLRLRTLLLHSSGQQLDCGVLAADVDLANPQKVGSAITYFRRYALAAISQTVADEDDDANAASQNRMSEDQSTTVARALKEIASQKTLEDLKDLGKRMAEVMKEESPIVQQAVRPAYLSKQRQLEKETKDADSRSDQTAPAS